MDITSLAHNGIPVLSLRGRLNQASADALHAAAMEIAGDPDSRFLIIDMDGVDFIASVGIRALIRPSQGMALKGGKLVVANLNPQLKDFFSLTGLDKMFTVCDSLDDATRTLGA